MSRYKYHLSYNFTSYNIKGSQIFRPIIPVILQYDNNPPVAITMLLDSGADYSLISKDVGRSLGINVNKNANSDVQGISGTTDTIEEKVKIEFGMGHKYTFKKEITIHTTKKEGYPSLPLLGREPIFKEFDVHFRLGLEESKRKFVLDKI
jgi:hypothetical protein